MIVFFLFNLMVSSYYLDTWTNANTVSRALPIISYFEEGTFKIDKYHELTCDKAYVNEHYYTDKAPLPTYVLLPFFGLMKSAGIIQPDAEGNLWGTHVLMLGSFLLGSLPFVLMLLVLFKRIAGNRKSVSPVLLSTLPFYGSFVFIFAGTYFAHVFAGILLLLSYVFLKRDRWFIGGFFAGLAFLSEYNLAVFIFMLGIMILVKEKKFKPFLVFSLGILPSLLFLIYYNSLFSSSPFTFMYKHHNFSELEANYGFVLPGLESIWGLSFSTYRGIFFFAPFLLILLLALIQWRKEGKIKYILNSYLFFPFVIYYIFIASYFAWWGGWTYGPRLLLAVILLILYEGIVWISNKRFSPLLFYIVSVFGLLVIFLAKFTMVYSAPTGIKNPFYDLAVKGVLENNFNPNNLLSMVFGTDPAWSALLFVILFITGMGCLMQWYKKCQQR